MKPEIILKLTRVCESKLYKNDIERIKLKLIKIMGRIFRKEKWYFSNISLASMCACISIYNNDIGSTKSKFIEISAEVIIQEKSLLEPEVILILNSDCDLPLSKINSKTAQAF